MSGPYTLVPVQPVKVLNAQTASGAQGILYLRGQGARATVVCQGDGTTSSGVITIEEAYYAGPPEGGDLVYSGTWSTITTVNATDITGGAQKVIHITGSIWALRVRISTIIGGGGTVSAWAYGN